MDAYPALQKLRAYIEREDFKGYDPYDALNSPLLRFLSLGRKPLRIAFIQAMKRLPWNLRPYLGIPKGHNPKGLGLVLWGYAKLFKREQKTEYLETIELLMEMLERLKSPGYSGNAWGYNFDWQSRTFFIPRFTPTVVNSSFIGHALLDTYRITGKEKALGMAMSIKDFILRDLNKTEKNGTICFSYSPVDRTAVHNANLLGSSLLIRLNKYARDSHVKDLALASLAYTMNHQKEDGSWYYAQSKSQRWIDSFHTGFNLQCIRYFLEEGYAADYKEAFEKGLDFYIKNFFLEDGTPKYFSNAVYPIDIHAPAQAVVFFTKMGPAYQGLAEKILAWMIRHMQDQRGFFYFQKGRFVKRKIPYMRWSQAWAFHALTEYVVCHG